VRFVLKKRWCYKPGIYIH